MTGWHRSLLSTRFNVENYVIVDLGLFMLLVFGPRLLGKVGYMRIYSSGRVSLEIESVGPFVRVDGVRYAMNTEWQSKIVPLFLDAEVKRDYQACCTLQADRTLTTLQLSQVATILREAAMKVNGVLKEFHTALEPDFSSFTELREPLSVFSEPELQEPSVLRDLTFIYIRTLAIIEGLPMALEDGAKWNNVYDLMEKVVNRQMRGSAEIFNIDGPTTEGADDGRADNQSPGDNVG